MLQPGRPGAIEVCVPNSWLARLTRLPCHSFLNFLHYFWSLAHIQFGAIVSDLRHIETDSELPSFLAEGTRCSASS